jgi:hypothetical protein
MVSFWGGGGIIPYNESIFKIKKRIIRVITSSDR